MLNEKRLEELTFQAFNNGHSKVTVERAQKEKRKIDDRMSTMVVISPTELQHFLGFREIALKLEGVKEKAESLQKFKDFVHDRLTGMGVPVEFPDGEHTQAGCRIGDRLDYVQKEITTNKELK